MWTTIWLIVTTFIGFEISLWFTAFDPLLGALIGFGSGSVIRLLIATGGEGVDILEGLFDLLGCLGD